jgi:hypothetical protein
MALSRTFQPRPYRVPASFRDARKSCAPVGASVCDVKARCWESSAMDAAERCGEGRRMQARDDVDDGAGCGGVAWGNWIGGVCGVSELGLFTPGAASRLASHPGIGRPAQPLGTLPLHSLPAPVVRAGQVRRCQQNRAALCASLHPRPRTSRRLHSSALRGGSGDLPPRGSGRGRWGGCPTEHVESLSGCQGAVPAAQSPAHRGLARAFLARGGTNAGQRVPARLPEVRSGEA